MFLPRLLCARLILGDITTPHNNPGILGSLIPILRMKILRLIEGKQLAQDQTARQQLGYQSLYSTDHIVSQPGLQGKHCTKL